MICSIHSKAVSNIIGYVLVLTLVVTLTASAYGFVLPRLSDMKSRSELEYMTIYMLKIDDKIKNVAHGGEGSKDYVTFNIQKGVLNVFKDRDEIEYAITSNLCMETEKVPNLYFEKEVTGGICVNKIILNYTTINITIDITRSGFVQLYVENSGFQENRPLIKIE